MKFLILIFSIFYSTSLYAQFSYTGVRISFHNVRFDKGDILESTRINDLVANIDFVHRPIRNLGIGVSARLPILHGFKYAFVSNDYYSEIVGRGSADERKVEYAGGNFEYNIQNTFSLTLFGRVYFDTEKNYFLDLRYTFETYKETLQFVRTGNSLPNENIQYEAPITAKGVGFAVGYQPKIGDHFYMTYVFAVDFLRYDDVSFNYDIQKSDNGYGDDFTNIKSKIDDRQTAYEFSFGIGYVF